MSIDVMSSALSASSVLTIRSRSLRLAAGAATFARGLAGFLTAVAFLTGALRVAVVFLTLGFARVVRVVRFSDSGILLGSWSSGPRRCHAPDTMNGTTACYHNSDEIAPERAPRRNHPFIVNVRSFGGISGLMARNRSGEWRSPTSHQAAPAGTPTRAPPCRQVRRRFRHGRAGSGPPPGSKARQW